MMLEQQDDVWPSHCERAGGVWGMEIKQCWNRRRRVFTWVLGAEQQKRKRRRQVATKLASSCELVEEVLWKLRQQFPRVKGRGYVKFGARHGTVMGLMKKLHHLVTDSQQSSAVERLYLTVSAK